MAIQAKRYHDISVGHRVVGHEGKCRHFHGHNYRVHFTCEAHIEKDLPVDEIGRVIDFGEIKRRLCMWLEDNWDHKFIYCITDPVIKFLCEKSEYTTHENIVIQSFVAVPFNPTAENMASYLLTTIGPLMLKGTGIQLVDVTIEETAKCSATANFKARLE